VGSCELDRFSILRRAVLHGLDSFSGMNTVVRTHCFGGLGCHSWPGGWVP
jgi:hypothetical protein